jgi:alkanesulfonate monooxygenase SsuD/methylene tetrahydromethanopterin reductase-like flavin-dependent oxidoreductase (luciferase family)
MHTDPQFHREAGRRAGHPPERLQVGLHLIGYLSETPDRARDEAYPGYAAAFNKIGKERGWGPVNRAQFDTGCGPSGAFLIGDAEMVAQKILSVNEALGGLHRVNVQMTLAAVPHGKMLRSIEILGAEVAPRVRKMFEPS